MKMTLKVTATGAVILEKEIKNEGTFPSGELEQQFQKFIYTNMDLIAEKCKKGIPSKYFEVVDVDVYHNTKLKRYESTIDVYNIYKPATDEDFNASNVFLRASLIT